jgi:hypothetical protein
MRRIALRQPPSADFWAGAAALEATAVFGVGAEPARVVGSAMGSKWPVRCKLSSKVAPSGLVRGVEAEMWVRASENESTEAEGDGIGEARGEPEREDE